jgi:hypothetical protein
MDQNSKHSLPGSWPKLRDLPLPAKALATMVILMVMVGLGIAAGQAVIHDIIPTFLSEEEAGMEEVEMSGAERGDLFAEEPKEEKKRPFYKTDEFIFALKFSHIHIFGMTSIFVHMGVIALFLDLSLRARVWLVVLPFIGILMDLAAIWLKLFVSPSFFWLHIPGFGILGTLFTIVSGLALFQMWGPHSAASNVK